MEKVKVNLDTLVSSAVHSHNYKRVDGKLASNSKYVRELERQREVYTSPRNVRKLFIKHTGVDVVYYRPVIGKSDSLCESLKFSESDRKALQLAMRDMVQSCQDGSDMTRVSLVGTGFASFLNDLSLSNLEELYFDWTLLLGNRDLFLSLLQLNASIREPLILGLEVIEKDRYCDIKSNTTETKRVLQAKKLSDKGWNTNVNLVTVQLYEYIVAEMSGGAGLAQKYPRLKHIGFLNNKNLVLKSTGEISKKELIKYGNQAIYNHCKKEQIIACGKELMGFSVFFDTNVDLYTAGFRVATGLYQFDKDYLVDYFKADVTQGGVTQEAELTKWFSGTGTTKLGLEYKLKWADKFNSGQLVGQRQVYSDTDKPEIRDKTSDIVPKTSIEKSLVIVREAEGIEAVALSIKNLLLMFSIKAVKDMIADFSDDGRKFFGLVLEEILNERESK